MLRRHAAVLLTTAGLLAGGFAAPAGADPGHGQALGHGKGHCPAFHASGQGVDDATGTTTATIYRGNREIGSTVGTFSVTGVNGAGVASFTGTIVFTNDHGTVIAPVTGTLDTVSGVFESSSDTLSGTGDYADVTGRMRFSGVEDLTALTFTETLQGKVCTPKHRQH